MTASTPRIAVAPDRPFITLVRYNRPYWKAYGIGACLAVLFILFSLLTPVIIGRIVAGFEKNTMTYALVMGYFFTLMGLSIVEGVVRYFQRRIMIGSSRHFEYDLRNDLFRHVERLSQRFFHKNRTGDIMARATSDINYVREFMGPGVMGTADMVRVPFTLGYMIYLSGKLTLFSLVPLPLISVLVYACVWYMNRQSKVVQELFSLVTSRAQENLAGARVVKAYGIADRESRDFRKDSEAYMRANIKLVAFMSFAFPLIGMIVGAVLLMVIWQGGNMVIQREIDLATLSQFLIALIMLAWPLAQFGWVLTLYQRGAVSMKRIMSILCEAPDIRDDTRTDPNAAVTAGAISFRGVSFKYDEVLVLNEVSFDVEAGETVAIVGPTGCGKTTIVSLLTREYEPTTGEVFVDGRPLTQIPLARLRGALGYVPQDTFIFSDTIRANVTLGRPQASEEEIWHACEVAQLAETLRQMPQGLDTLLGERGINLSGGQKQRLALARALLRDPVVLILDDAFSSVDTHTEEHILHRLHEVMKRRTNILISHRISSVAHAHLILVVEEGRIIERGTHEELLRLDGLYAEMFRRQQLETALEDVA
ncbi:MAG: ABC transporter ATP-binding protein [Candidatus Hydrogenedentes bacterium]|nr:ABC transporter ATP-binding protein [Candidatus Hydrogenedentota bacterium]